MKIAGSHPLGNAARSIIEVRTTPTLLHDLTRDHLAGVVRGLNQIAIPSDRGQVVCLPRNHDLRVVVRKLRKKIEVDATRPRILLTELGIGYRLEQ